MFKNVTLYRFLMLCAAAVVPLCATTNETSIKKSIVVQERIPATLMQTSFTVEKEEQTPNEILKSFSSTNKIIVGIGEKEEITCKGGQNRINPNYVVGEKNKSVFSGYRGAMSYICTFDKIQSYNVLLNTSLDGGQRLNLSPIQWVALESKKKESEKALEQKLTKEALTSVSEYSDILSSKCSLKSLEFISSVPYRQNMVSFAKAERLVAPLENFQPTQDDIVMQLTGMVEILCIN